MSYTEQDVRDVRELSRMTRQTSESLSKLLDKVAVVDVDTPRLAEAFHGIVTAQSNLTLAALLLKAESDRIATYIEQGIYS